MSSSWGEAEGSPAEVAVVRHPGVDVVSVNGDLDLRSHHRVRRVLGDVEQVAATEVVLDLSGVPFLDSLGAAAIVASRRRLQAREATLSLVAAESSPARRALTWMGLHEVFTFHDSVEDAVAELGHPTA